MLIVFHVGNGNHYVKPAQMNYIKQGVKLRT